MCRYTARRAEVNFDHPYSAGYELSPTGLLHGNARHYGCFGNLALCLSVMYSKSLVQPAEP